MKNLIFLLLLVVNFSLQSKAASTEGLVAVKGTVVRVSKMPSGFTEVYITDGKAVSFSNFLGQKNVESFLSNRGFTAAILESSNVIAETCKEAVLVITGGKGNILPNENGEESYTYPEIVNFSCINK
jgi:hypothetical protein